MKLYNANSIEIFKDIINKHKDKKIIIVSDPPFNINFKYNTYTDDLKEDDYYSMLRFFFKDLPSVVIHYPEQLYKLSIRMSKAPDKVCTWVYNSNLNRQHRDIAFFGIEPDFDKVRQKYKENSKKTRKLMAEGTGGHVFTTGGILIK